MNLNSDSLSFNSAEFTMSKHGKSFYFASQVFSKNAFFKINLLYTYCRFVDDTADKNSSSTAKEQLDKLKNYILDSKLKTSSLDSKYTFSENLTSNAERSISTDNFEPHTSFSFEFLVHELQSFGIPKAQLLTLIDGALFDVEARKIENRTDFIRYCYLVAGVVGQMMIPLLNVNAKSAQFFAIDLGIGMQITNICRDILEDAKIHRTYLPAEELNNLSLSLDRLQQQGPTPDTLKQLLNNYLSLSDTYYRSAFLGFSYIPLRPRFAILFASEIYRHIGLKIKAKNYEVLHGRIYLTSVEKFFVCFKSLIKVFHIRFWTPGSHNDVLHKSLKEWSYDIP